VEEVEAVEEVEEVEEGDTAAAQQQASQRETRVVSARHAS